MRNRWLYQFSCSLVVACVVVWVNEAKGASAFLGKLAYPLEVCLFPILRSIYHDESFRNGSFVFCAMCFLLAVAIFALVRLLSYVLPEKPFLLIAAGIADVAAYPLGFLWLRSFYHVSTIIALWLKLELVVCAAAIVFYFCRWWRLPSLMSVLLIAVHFAFWGGVNHNYDALIGLGTTYGFWSVMFWGTVIHRVSYLFIGFFGTVAWARYVGADFESRETSRLSASAARSNSLV